MTEEHYKNRELDMRFVAHEDLDKQRFGEVKDILAEGFKDISEKIVGLTEQVKTSNGRTRKLEIKWAWATGAGGVFVAATLGAGGWMFNAIVEVPPFVQEQAKAMVKQEIAGYKLVSDPPVRQSPVINTINIRNATTSDDIVPIMSTTTP